MWEHANTQLRFFHLFYDVDSLLDPSMSLGSRAVVQFLQEFVFTVQNRS